MSSLANSGLNKQATTTAAAFQKVLDDAGVVPKFLWQDRGTELAGAMKTLCTARGVKQYSTGGEGKAVIAERMIRTVRDDSTAWPTLGRRGGSWTCSSRWRTTSTAPLAERTA